MFLVILGYYEVLNTYMNLLFLAIIHYNMRQTALFMNYAKIKCISKSKIQLFFKSRFYLKVHQ